MSFIYVYIARNKSGGNKTTKFLPPRVYFAHIIYILHAALGSTFIYIIVSVRIPSLCVRYNIIPLTFFATG